MYLKQLELNGFKSFVNARVAFQSGITAVVGPNGTGKSNILDAILWVLGEQSTKTLRSERMEDVIFNGTESRQPQGMVEVSLILGDVNTDGAPLPYSLGECQEVMVTRRLFRDGVSEYFINQVPCRLKDLRALLLDSRAGSKGHTVIEQGMIDRLLKASPIERRELIEETAGIIRFKKQKAEALRKLDATTQNLLRVRDIINEVKRQLGGLERQAKAAEAYQSLRQEIRRLELIVLVHDYQAASDNKKECEHLLSDLADQQASQDAVCGRLIAQAEALRFEVTESEDRISHFREQVAQAETRLTQAATAIELLAQRAAFLEEQRTRVQADVDQILADQQEETETLSALRSRVESLSDIVAAKSQMVAQQEAFLTAIVQRYHDSQEALEKARASVMQCAMAAASVENRLVNARERAADLSRRTERFEQERVQAVTAVEASTTQLAACVQNRMRLEGRVQQLMASLGGMSDGIAAGHQQLTDADHQVMTIQEELTDCSARLKALQTLSRDRALHMVEESEPVRDTLSQVLTVPAPYDAAIEAALGHKLMATLVDGPQDAVRLLKRVKSDAAGSTYIPKRPRLFRTQTSPELQGPGLVGPAMRLVMPRPGYEELLSHLLGGVLIVQDLEHALALWQTMSEDRQALLVTLQGEIVTSSGIVMARPADMAVGVMARERELERLTWQAQELTEALKQAKAERARVAEILSGQSQLQNTQQEEVRLLQMQLVGERKDEARAEEELAQGRQRLEVLMAERQAAEAEMSALAGTTEADRNEVRRTERERVAAEEELVAVQAVVVTNQQALEQQQTALSAIRLEVASLTERLEQSRVEMMRLQAVVTGRESRLTELNAELARIDTGATGANADRQQTEAGVPTLQAGLAEARQHLLEQQDAQVVRISRLRAAESEGAKLRQALEDIHRQQTAVQLRQREAELRLEGYQEQMHGTYGVSVDAALTEIGDMREENVAMVRERLGQRRGRLQDLGPVNVMAIDEHKELDERLRFLTTQEQDLAQSVASLKAIIAKINRTTKQLFLNTFAELQTRFDEMFRNFFEGGRAELVLVEDEEGGEPGVDIVAQPPGKRLKNIAMLSGGERALTAMALIFASFLIRPTPFCVLDEIDAPLDEENTARFIRVLQGLSARCQFIVITHSKQTMEVADCLYGVTMEEAGVSTLVSVRLNKQLEPA